MELRDCELEFIQRHAAYLEMPHHLRFELLRRAEHLTPERSYRWGDWKPWWTRGAKVPTLGTLEEEWLARSKKKIEKDADLHTKYLDDTWDGYENFDV